MSPGHHEAPAPSTSLEGDAVGHESAQHLVRVLEQSPALITLTSLRDGRLLSVNTMFERLTGYSRGEALGRTLVELSLYADPADREALVASLEQEGRVYEREMLFRNRDGAGITALVSAEVIQYRDEPCILAVATDITARQRAEQDLVHANRQLERLYDELQRSEAYFRAVFDTAGVGILSLDEAGHIDRVNPAARRILGRSMDELLGRSPLGFVHGDDQAEVGRLLNAQQRGDIGAFQNEHRWVSAGGGSSWLQVHVAPFRRPDGTLESALVVVTDVTAHREYEDRLHQARETAESVSRAKGGFLALMSHELRTPLGSVLGITESLLEESAGPLTDTQRKYLQAVADGGRHLLGTVGDILDLASLEDNSLTMETQPVLVAEACETALTAVRQAALDKGQILRADVGETGLRCDVDPARLRQVLVHLLANAVKFTPEGGHVGLHVEGGEHDVRLEVSDTGIGIPASDRQHLFEPFVQANGGLRRAHGGAGLGLTLSRRLARLWGGDVAVHSEVGAGSTFVVTVPRHAPRRSGGDHSRRVPLILLADDNALNVEVLRDYLGVKGYEVAVAADGREAVDGTLRLQPDLVLMDIQMPVLDGLEAIRQIRGAGLGTLPIIALTALAMPGDQERCLAAGADAYVAKPVSPRGLVARIEEMLSARRPSGGREALTPDPCSE